MILIRNAILMRGINLYLWPLEPLSRVCYCKDFVYYIERLLEGPRHGSNIILKTSLNETGYVSLATGCRYSYVCRRTRGIL